MTAMNSDDKARHPMLDMLDANEPEALEYWLADDGLQTIEDDFEAGRIDAATHHKRLMAWVAECRKRLEAWKGEQQQADAHLLTARVWVKPGNKIVDPAAPPAMPSAKSIARGKNR